MTGAIDEEVWAEAQRLANSFLDGELTPLAAAWALSRFESQDHPAEADEPLLALLAVASETDAIPLGERRRFWYPDVRPAEDAKHDRAQEWARPIVQAACRQLVAIAGA
jgi:hypothetical protein